jgi:hypothetical protein
MTDGEASASRARPTDLMNASPARWVTVASLASVALFAGCHKSEKPATQGATAAAPAPAASAPCAHAACSDHFYVEAAPGACAAGATCSLELKVVATGDYHINDDYPYRFKADDAPGVVFQGANAADKDVFSKPAGDWRKTEAKSGAMSVRFTPDGAGEKTISGTFKVSVCSAENCLLEQPKVRTVVAAK